MGKESTIHRNSPGIYELDFVRKEGGITDPFSLMNFEIFNRIPGYVSFALVEDGYLKLEGNKVYLTDKGSKTIEKAV